MTDDPAWQEFVEHFRREAVGKISGSAAFISIVPDPEGFDIKFAAELGACIWFGKPLIVFAPPGREIPPKLREIADEVIEGDIDTEDGQLLLKQALAKYLDT